MIGNLVQYALYALCWLTIVLVVSGCFAVRQARKGGGVDLNHWLSGLALIAGTAPYVGLFGTVWHIIQALGGIGTGNLNVAAIAQPIGQALYATLWGLGCAIPAFIGYRVIVMLAPKADEGDSAATAEAEA